MNYDLAKKLKDAGFQFRVFGTYPQCGFTWVFDGDDNYYECPTLSELIEACGEDLAQIGAAVGGWNVWQLGVQYPVAFGKTPEEAVSNLWLALNTN